MSGSPDGTTARRGFSTLGCVDLDAAALIQVARRHRIEAIEIRGMKGRMDQPGVWKDAFGTPARMGEVFRAGGLSIVSLNTSFVLARADEASCAALLEQAHWADGAGVPWLRVFGGGNWDPAGPTGETVRAAAQALRWWGAERAARGIRAELIVETHDAFSASLPMLRLMEAAGEPFAVLWDTHHTWKLGKEGLAHSWSLIGQHVRHIHWKDSASKPSARHPYTYVLPGEGEFPMQELADVLRGGGYGGVVSLEWERHWHPYLPHIERALEAAARTPVWS